MTDICQLNENIQKTYTLCTESKVRLTWTYHTNSNLMCEIISLHNAIIKIAYCDIKILFDTTGVIFPLPSDCCIKPKGKTLYLQYDTVSDKPVENAALEKQYNASTCNQPVSNFRLDGLKKRLEKLGFKYTIG